MAPSRIQEPDDLFRITSPGSGRTTFMTKKAKKRIRLESKDRKAKLEVRTLRRAEAGSGFQKELEKGEGGIIVGDCLQRKLAAHENTLKGLSVVAKDSKKRVDHREGEPNLERMKHETVEALGALMLYS